MEESIEIVINQPDMVNIPLFLHQLKSIEAMENVEKTQEIPLGSSMYINTKIGILGDLPGYGKSLSMLGLISRTQPKTSEIEFYQEKVKSYGYISLTKVEPLQPINTTLILVNISLLSQWINELNRTLLKYIAVYSKNDIEDLELGQYDVVIVANNVYNLFSQVYRKKYWRRFVIDEPASLKLYAMEQTNAEFYWLITGTPHELYLKRRTGFLNELLPEDIDMFNHVIIKNDDQFVKKSYDMPITRHLYYKCTGNISKLFDGIVSDVVIEMIEAGNIGGVFNSFNISEEQTDSTLIESYKNRKIKRLYELEKEEKTDKNMEKIQLIQDHLKTIDDRVFRYVIENSCLICKTSHKIPMVLSCCQHIYCGECVHDICPLCRSTSFNKLPLTIKEFKNSEYVQYMSYSSSNFEPKNKIEILLDIIENCQDRKILIFSNYNDSFSIIKKFLDQRNLTYLELKGTKEQRDNTIDSYKSGNVNILLLNTIHSGAGLNLQETTDIILYHRIHEYQKIQVIGRANRIGRTNQLTVHYLE